MSSETKLCCLHINEPDHIFDRGLKEEAEKVAEELTQSGFPIRVEVRYGRGDESRQLRQIEEDRRNNLHLDLFVVIPTNKDAVYTIFSEVVRARDEVTCVLLHQPLTRMQLDDVARGSGRLFSVTADQKEIGRQQARQFAAVLPDGHGDVLYVQGRQNSFATKERMMGVLEELPRTGGVKLNGYRVYGDWSPESVRPAIDNWVELGGRLEWIQAAGAQNDDMALALAALLRDRGRSVPVIGVDGLSTGRQAVAQETLAATVVQPLGVGHALRVFRDLGTGTSPQKLIPEDGNIVLSPESYPSLDDLQRRSSA